MKCKLCGKPIKLVPSAHDRDAKYGAGTSKVFVVHARCQLEKRKRDTADLIRRHYKS